MVQIWQAKIINEEFGGAFVLPWEVDELPEEWIEATVGKRVMVPQLAEGKRKVADAVEAWRKKISRKQ